MTPEQTRDLKGIRNLIWDRLGVVYNGQRRAIEAPWSPAAGQYHVRRREEAAAKYESMLETLDILVDQNKG